MTEWINARETPPPKDGSKFVAIYVRPTDNQIYEHILHYEDCKLMDSTWISFREDFEYWMPWNPPKLPKKKHYCKITSGDGFESLQCIEYKTGKLKIVGNSNHGHLVIDTVFCPICGKKAG